MDKKDNDPKDDFLTVEELEDSLLEAIGYDSWEEYEASSSEQDYPDFDFIGGRESFFLIPRSPRAFIWIDENLGLPFWNLPALVHVPDKELNTALCTLLEDGMTFSGSLH